uniref:Uncharacterized protein n=1 Tax=Aegilops tauschii subsp. strangulata TaxID=200361 RepID=A0A452Z564_AEGTS
RRINPQFFVRCFFGSPLVRSLRRLPIPAVKRRDPAPCSIRCRAGRRPTTAIAAPFATVSLQLLSSACLSSLLCAAREGSHSMQNIGGRNLQDPDPCVAMGRSPVTRRKAGVRLPGRIHGGPWAERRYEVREKERTVRRSRQELAGARRR